MKIEKKQGDKINKAPKCLILKKKDLINHEAI